MMTISGLHHTARSLAVYASQPGLPRHHARLAPGCWPALPGGAGYPQGPIERFPRYASPFPELSWRTSGRPGRLPTSAPHGAGRAQFRHPALRATNLPATSRPRPCPLSAVVLWRWYQGSVSLASIPPAVSWPGASFPRRGPSGRFPRVTGTTRRSDSPPPLPPHFVAFAWRYPGRIRVSFP